MASTTTVVPSMVMQKLDTSVEVHRPFTDASDLYRGPVVGWLPVPANDDREEDGQDATESDGFQLEVELGHVIVHPDATCWRRCEVVPARDALRHPVTAALSPVVRGYLGLSRGENGTCVLRFKGQVDPGPAAALDRVFHRDPVETSGVASLLQAIADRLADQTADATAETSPKAGNVTCHIRN